MALQDLRRAGRSLRRSPGFTLTALVTVALGVGVPTAMFTVVNGVVLRPLPYPEAGRLVRVWAANPQRAIPFFSVSAPDAIDWMAQAPSLGVVGAFERPQSLALTDGDQPDEVVVSRVTPGTFEVLAVAARVGRPFADADGPGALVLGDALWQRRFGGDPSVLGRRLTLDGQAFTVTGVMPPLFSVPGSAAEAWVPLDLRAQPDRARRTLRVLARLAPGATVGAARADLEAVAGRLAASYPATNGGWSVTLRTVQEAIVGPDVRQALFTLLGVVGLVMLIACANVAHLVLVRAASRQRELAVRAALGAGRRHLVGQILAESLLLAVAGSAAGLGVAAVLIDGLRAAAPAALPRLEDVHMDARVFAFAAGAALVAAALCGLVPALQASGRKAVGRALQGARGVVGFRGSRTRTAIVGVEVALAVVVTTGSLLLVRSLLRLQDVAPGFRASGVTIVPLRAGEGDYADRGSVTAFYDAVLSAVETVPGVREVSLVSSPPFFGGNPSNVVGVEGQTVDRARAPDADYRVVSPGYFAALGIPLRRGRDFGREDRAGAPPVVIVNEVMARRLWPGQDAVGRRFRIGDVDAGPWVTIVGLAGDVLYRDLEAPEARPMFYTPHAQAGERAMTLVVHTAGPSAPDGAALRQAVWRVDKAIPVPTVRSLEDVLSIALAGRRFNASVFVLFAGLAMALSAVGVYGAMVYFVTLRRSEIGVRVALGATPRAVALFVLRRGGAPVAAGMAAGIAGALLLGPALRGLLYGVTPADPGTLLAVAGLFGAVIAVAAWAPARRAMRLEPARILNEG